MIFQRKQGVYERYIKRLLDVICSVLVIVLFSWLYLIIALLIKINMGSPVLFKQARPGRIDSKTGKERIFNLYKFRTMTDARDDKGKLLSDSDRLTSLGVWLRQSSIDETPEFFSILKGDMSFVGPRPQLVRDMVFMTDEQRMRHTARPGLTGLAQIKGRNAITWEEKLAWDIKYIEKVTFINDVMIVLKTLAVVFIKSGITDGKNATALDYGDVLLKEGKVSPDKYNDLKEKANKLMMEHKKRSKHGNRKKEIS